MPSIQIRPPKHHETPLVVELLTRGESDMRRHLITTTVSAALQNPVAKTIALVAAENGNVLGAAIASTASLGHAVLIGMRTADDAVDRATEPLFDSVARALQTMGTTFVQAASDFQSQPLELIAAKFDHLADLHYLTATTESLSLSLPPQREPITFIPSESLTEATLVELVSRTYEDTQDCPEMSDYRSVQETLASYRSARSHDASMWRIAVSADQSVGCVFGVPFPDSSTLELTYMGIIPEHRGKAYGNALIAEVTRMASDAGLESVNLAVDLRNEPALRIYRRLGFKPFFQESMWGRRI